MIPLRTLFVLMLVASHAAMAQDDLSELFGQDVLVVVARHECHRFDVYLALERAQQRRGLMFVRELPVTSGMLFVYDDEAIASMWMKNTFIPLDILFATADGRVSSIEKDTTPQSLRSIRSTEPVTYVLELNAGVTDLLAIEVGSWLIWEPAFERRSNGE